MLSIRDLTEQFMLQGPFCIKSYVDDISDYKILSDGNDFESALLEDDVMDAEITYMYVQDNELHIEVKMEDV